jgi:hypothetical protein
MMRADQPDISKRAELALVEEMPVEFCDEGQRAHEKDRSLD